MTISLNGESAETRGAQTIKDLVEFYRLPPQTILIEHNGQALHRHQWPDQKLVEGDRVEVLRVVAGG